jgi:hypothetical protein
VRAVEEEEEEETRMTFSREVAGPPEVSDQLLVAIRGGAGSGKSLQAFSLADAGIGRIALLDTENKARSLPKGGRHPNVDVFACAGPGKLEARVDWMLDVAPSLGRTWAGVILDSFDGYFTLRWGAFIRRMKAVHGSDYQPSSQETLNEIRDITLVMSRLTRESNMTVFITDTFERGEAAHEGNETGVLMTPTLAGIEKFVDLVVETAVEADLRPRYFSTVVKSNLADIFPLSERFENASASMYLAQYRAARAAELGDAGDAATAAPGALDDMPEPTQAPTLLALRTYYLDHGFTEAALVNGAKRHCGGRALEQLTNDDRRLLLRRLDEYLSVQAPQSVAGSEDAERQRATSSTSRRAGKVA